MGKSVPSPSRFQNLARIISSNRLNNSPNQIKPVASKARPVSSSEARPTKPSGLHKAELPDHQQHRLKNRKMEVGNSNPNPNLNSSATMPLAEVVADCVKRWFQDTLKEAKAGDTVMQVLVGQMYYSGYGVPKDAQKGRAWINRASRSRSSAWKVGDKRPGYNASDSDSNDGN